jgi:predicted RNA-binding protein with PUA-like domain
MASRQIRGKKRKLTEITPDQTEEAKEAKISAPAITHWLMKSEPDSRIEKGVDMKFSFDDLKAMPNSTSCWDGVRNYQARNFMREMRVGQQVFFYHSNTKPPGIIGIAEVTREAYPDHTQFDKKDPHYDPGASKVSIFI